MNTIRHMCTTNALWSSTWSAEDSCSEGRRRKTKVVKDMLSCLLFTDKKKIERGTEKMVWVWVSVCEWVCVCVCVCVVCVCVCVCVCVRVFVTNQDIDLYNDTGMTQVLQGEGDFSGHWPMSPLFKTLINHTEWGFFGESWNAQSPVRAKFRYRVGVGQ